MDKINSHNPHPHPMRRYNVRPVFRAVKVKVRLCWTCKRAVTHHLKDDYWVCAICGRRTFKGVGHDE